ncbi:MAG TPA: Clp protease N-terminal domain-containing protein [Arachnia sp.]|jgi:ATP-dependent Clp protease ATP-binding subunit ClpA|nr:Clp protease N-terminal domain-containing protein [Arachnia sp.]
MNAVQDIRTIKALLTEAEQQALALGESKPAAEHLVLAALLLDEGSARTLLGVDADQFRAALVSTHAAALASLGMPSAQSALPPATANKGVYRSEQSSQDVFQRARVLAKQDRPRGLKGSHIVRAAAEREHGTVARVLATLGIDIGFRYRRS